MILVLLGTFPIEFNRPLIEIEKLCHEGKINEEIIVQSGYTQFSSSYMKIYPFIPPPELAELYQQARIIISHAGSGSLIKGIKLNKKIIAIARLAKYNEVVDDHQLEILNEFARLNFVIPWNENSSLQEILSEVDQFEPSVYISNKDKIIKYLTDYIDSL